MIILNFKHNINTYEHGYVRRATIKNKNTPNGILQTPLLATYQAIDLILLSRKIYEEDFENQSSLYVQNTFKTPVST